MYNFLFIYFFCTFQHINTVNIRTSFFYSDINKLVSVVINTIVITNNAEEKRNAVVETILKPLLSKQNSSSRPEGLNDEANSENITEYDFSSVDSKQLLDFRDKKLPPILIMFAQVI